MAPLDALKEIARMIREEVDQPGTNDDRFRALIRAEKVAQAAITEAEKQPA